MDYTVTEETFSRLSSYWTTKNGSLLNWNSIFSMPEWMQNWWSTFASGEQLYLRSVQHKGETIGIAPLLIRERTASLVGSDDICDYLDFIVSPGSEKAFFNVLLDELEQNGVHELDLGHLRPDSTVYGTLVSVARQRNYTVSSSKESVSLEVDLPDTWEDYLASLNKKQRHEVRRKIRRLENAGKLRYDVVEDRDHIAVQMDVFLKMFVASREDKESFMTPVMESFFRSIADTFSRVNLLKLGVLELDGQIVSMVIYFDHNDSFLLYNSAYDPGYASLSVGLVSKVMCIRDSIEKGKGRFDFLKGREPYKYHLGGKETPLYRCRIALKPD